MLMERLTVVESPCAEAFFTYVVPTDNASQKPSAILGLQYTVEFSLQITAKSFAFLILHFVTEPKKASLLTS